MQLHGSSTISTSSSRSSTAGQAASRKTLSVTPWPVYSGTRRTPLTVPPVQAEAKLSAQERSRPPTTPTSEIELFAPHRNERNDQWAPDPRIFNGEQRLSRDEVPPRPGAGGGGGGVTMETNLGSNMGFDFDTCDFISHSSNYPFNHAQRHQSVGWYVSATPTLVATFLTDISRLG